MFVINIYDKNINRLNHCDPLLFEIARVMIDWIAEQSERRWDTPHAWLEALVYVKKSAKEYYLE